MLGHIGARGTAFSNVTMLDSEFDFDEIRVTSRRPESREAFGAALREALGKPVRWSRHPEEAVRGADIVGGGHAARRAAGRCSAPTGSSPGALVVPYGTVSAVELSLTTIMDKIVVDDWGQCRQGRFGALRPHVERGLLSEDNLHAELGADRRRAARPAASGTTSGSCCWHRGLATTDVAVGQLICERAAARGLGTMLHYR